LIAYDNFTQEWLPDNVYLLVQWFYDQKYLTRALETMKAQGQKDSGIFKRLEAIM